MSILVSGTYGAEQANHGNSKLGAIDPIVTWKTPLKGLQLIGEYLYASESAPIAVSAFPNSYGNQLTGVSELFKSADWQGFAGYAVYDLNENIEFATRFEWFRDGQGVRSGLRQTLFEVTETLNYKVPLVNGLLARLEYRHDASNRTSVLQQRPAGHERRRYLAALPHLYRPGYFAGRCDLSVLGIQDWERPRGRSQLVRSRGRNMKKAPLTCPVCHKKLDLIADEYECVQVRERSCRILDVRSLGGDTEGTICFVHPTTSKTLP